MVECEITKETRDRMQAFNQSLSDEAFKALANQMVFCSEDKDRLFYIFQAVMMYMAHLAVEEDVIIEPGMSFDHNGKRYKVTIKMDIKEVEP